MADMDVFSAMGIIGFGKAAKKRELDPNRFDKTKREELVVRVSSFFGCHCPLIHFIRSAAQSGGEILDPCFRAFHSIYPGTISI